MVTRWTLAVLGVFWGVMTLWLWRTEYGPTRFQGTPVPPSLVWEKVLTSPDSSSLAIIHRGTRIGFCHVVATVNSSVEPSRRSVSPEGMVRQIRGYQLDVTGSLHPPDADLRLRFSARLVLTPEQDWQSFQVELVSRPTIIEATADREGGVLNLSVSSPDLRLARTLRLADLRSPELIVRELLGPAATFLPDLFPFPLDASALPGFDLGLDWTATTDQFMIRQSPVPSYRLTARLFEDSSVVLIISRAGEILRVELPDQMIWTNDALTGT